MKPIKIYNLTTGVHHAVCLDGDSASKAAAHMFKDAKPAEREAAMEQVEKWLKNHNDGWAQTAINCGTIRLEITHQLRERTA